MNSDSGARRARHLSCAWDSAKPAAELAQVGHLGAIWERRSRDQRHTATFCLAKPRELTQRMGGGGSQKVCCKLRDRQARHGRVIPHIICWFQLHAGCAKSFQRVMLNSPLQSYHRISQVRTRSEIQWISEYMTGFVADFPPGRDGRREPWAREMRRSHESAGLRCHIHSKVRAGILRVSLAFRCVFDNMLAVKFAGPKDCEKELQQKREAKRKT